MFEENITGCLTWINTNTIVCDNGTSTWIYFELFSDKFQNCCEGSGLRYLIWKSYEVVLEGVNSLGVRHSKMKVKQLTCSRSHTLKVRGSRWHYEKDGCDDLEAYGFPLAVRSI